MKTAPEVVAAQFLINLPGPKKRRYNIAPSQMVACVRGMPESSCREGVLLRWGLVPSWAKDQAIANKLINARAETVAEKPAFRRSFRHKRCLVLADGFYEWQREGRAKQPYFIRMNDERPFAFAGIWDHWVGGDGQTIESCAMLTTEPNDLMATIHHRMPVILKPEDYGGWLDISLQDSSKLLRFLYSYPAADMVAYPVSLRVNNPRFDEPACIDALGGC